MPSKILLTEDQIKDLAQLDSEELYDVYGWNSSQVSNYRKSYRITKYKRARKRRIPIPPVEELKNLTLDETMAKYEISRSTAKAWFRERGLRLIYSGGVAHARVKILEKTVEYANQQLRNQRLLYVLPFLRDVEVARAFNISRERARQIREMFKIPFCLENEMIKPELMGYVEDIK